MTTEEIVKKNTTLIGRWLFGTDKKLILNIKSLLHEERTKGFEEGLKSAKENQEKQLKSGAIYKALQK